MPPMEATCAPGIVFTELPPWGAYTHLKAPGHLRALIDLLTALYWLTAKEGPAGLSNLTPQRPLLNAVICV